MKALLRFVGWATLTFALTWFIAHPYQRVLGSLATKIAALWGPEIEWDQLESFFPYDISVFVALCLASSWASWSARLRALGAGTLVLVGVELLTLIGVIQVMLAAQGQPPADADATQRLVVGVIRVAGLVAAGCAWMMLLGWQRMPQFAENFATRRSAARGGKR